MFQPPPLTHHQIQEIVVHDRADHRHLRHRVRPHDVVDRRLAPRPSPGPAVQPSPASIPAIWTCIAYHESGGNWAIADGNGYYGGLQFAASTWNEFGGLAYAPTANLASPAEQVAVAQKVLSAEGWQAWPQTSLMCGE